MGSAAWWLLLSTAVERFGWAVDSGKIVWINRVCGAVVTLFGLAAVVGSLQ